MAECCKKSQGFLAEPTERASASWQSAVTSDLAQRRQALEEPLELLANVGGGQPCAGVGPLDGVANLGEVRCVRYGVFPVTN